MDEQAFELAFMPYLALDGTRELSFGRARVFNADALDEFVVSRPLRERVRLLLGMYRQQGRNPSTAQPLRGIGILTVKEADFRSLSPQEHRHLQALQRVIFLCCLANNAKLNGPNAGHSIFTADNFDMVRQGFTLTNTSIAEQVGVIVSKNLMGYKIEDTVFGTPTFVPTPLRFGYDERLFQQLRWLRRANPKLLRRILRAAEVFRSSYYNSHNLGVAARVLLQASSFEVLFDLPDKGQRMAFKATIERLVNNRKDRRYTYKYEVFGSKKTETRSLKGIWADRFYTLRNHLIHGEAVPDKEFVFRGAQHHLVVAPLMFVVSVKRLIDEFRASIKKDAACDSRVVWQAATDRDDDDGGAGFRVVTDLGAIIARALARRSTRPTAA